MPNQSEYSWINKIWELFDISSGIRRRIVVWFILASALPLLFAIVFSFNSGFSSMQAALGTNFGAVARQATGQFEANLSRESQWMADVLLDDVLVEWVKQANQLYKVDNPRPLVEQLMEARRQDFINHGGVQSRVLKNRISRRMRILSKARSGPSVLITVTDQEGALLAASDPTARFNYSDSYWFQKMSQNQFSGVHFAIVREAETLFVELVRPIYDGMNISGALRLLINFQALFYSGGLISLGDSGQGVLVDSLDGEIYGANFKPSQPLFPPPKEVPLGKKSDSGWFFNPESSTRFWRGIVGYSQVFSTPWEGGEREKERWYVLVSQNPEETYRTAKDSLFKGGVVGSFMVIVLGVIGLFVARHIASPLLALRRGVAQFAQGRSELTVEVNSDDEINDLAQEFNRMARTVRKTENRLRAFADAVSFSGDAILLSDLKNRIFYVNPAFEELTGYSKVEAMGRNPSIIASEKTAQSIYQDMWQTLQKDQPWRGEIINQQKNGSSYVVDIIISPILDKEDNKIGYMATQRDISLAKRMEAELKGAKIKLEKELTLQSKKLVQAEKLAAIGRMSAMIAHDMRNPLSAVKMNMQILQSGLDEMLNGDEKTHFQIAGEQIQYLEEIISSLLTYARSDSGNREWLELPRIIEGALIMVERQIQESQVEVQVDWDGGVQNLYGDPLQLRQLFQNLAINAIQAMSNCSDPVVSISGRQLMIESEDWVEVVVADQGKGVDSTICDKLFEPFVSGHAKGTGLGLAIVSRIVENHGGRVDLLNGISGGARAVVMLPILGNQAKIMAERL